MSIAAPKASPIHADRAAADEVNIALALTHMARQRPDAPAVLYPLGRNGQGRQQYARYSYSELETEATGLASGLQALGLVPGMRTVLMVRPSLEFFALTFGLFKAGIVPVMVDPGMGLKNLKICLEEARPEAFVGIPQAHAARIALGWARGSLKHLVTVGRRWFWGGATLDDARRQASPDWQPPRVAPEDMAAILFTSGSTGVPKGAVYSHGNFQAQVQLIRQAYDIAPGEVDLPTFPLFALFDPALGMTTVIPEMDFTRPGFVDPRNVLEPIEEFQVTNMFGSPALLDRVGRHGEARGVKLPSLRRVISAGAPVPAPVMERFASMLGPHARIVTPYGATESLPVATIDSHAILGETRHATDLGKGVCVGNPLAGVRLEVIKISDEPIEHWQDDLRVPPGEVGEFVVQGPQVTHSYFGREASTRLAKIASEDGSVMHRMGDVGYVDGQGRLWFAGRKNHRVTTAEGVMFSVLCENVFDTHPKVRRTALVGVPAQPAPGQMQRPVLCVELEEGAPRSGAAREAIRQELLALGQTQAHTRGVETILFHKRFPVDIRHNSKIFREKLALWAEEKL